MGRQQIEVCKRGHSMLQHGYIVPRTGQRQCRVCKNIRSRRYIKAPFRKSQLQFVKLVFDKYGEGEKLDEALKVVEEEGANVDEIKMLILPKPKKKLQRHQILLYEGDFALLQYKTKNATGFIRDFVHSQVKGTIDAPANG